MDPALEAAFTRELRAFVRAAGKRRALATTCHVGRPGAERVTLPYLDQLRGPRRVPHGLGTDLVVRGLDGIAETSSACAWVTRSGSGEVTSTDVEWFAAARGGFGCHGLDLPAFLVLHRYGWHDLVSGDRREWSRVRTR